MKHCKMCARVLPLSEFSIKSNTTQTPCSYCKECQRQYSRQHYRANKKGHNQRRYINQNRYKAENRLSVMEYLLQHPCVDCGEQDPVVLEFDHVRGKKDGNISKMVNTGLSWSRISREIGKCDVRCANCHRRKTVRDFKWFKDNFGA